MRGVAELLQRAGALLPEMTALRREIHRNPEIGLELPKTQQAVLAALGGLGLDIRTGRSLSSVVAVLRGARPGPCVLLRADMDALPVREQTGLAYAATNGAMHACGHDLHVAGLIGAVRLLTSMRDQLAGSVVFMFQPGEEGHAGARLMLEDGVLEASDRRPEAAYGIHVLTGQRGVFSTREGTLMAGANLLDVTLHGRGGHGSTPHLAVDPVPALAQLILALHAYPSRRFDLAEPVLLSVTTLQGSVAPNVIGDTARLQATVRTVAPGANDILARELPEMAAAIAHAHRCTAEVDYRVGYPMTVNDPETTARSVRVLRELVGADRVQLRTHPRMASEDFSFVLDVVPGTFLFLGASPAEVDQNTAEFNHSPRALFDDTVLPDHAAALTALALGHLDA